MTLPLYIHYLVTTLSYPFRATIHVLPACQVCYHTSATSFDSFIAFASPKGAGPCFEDPFLVYCTITTANATNPYLAAARFRKKAWRRDPLDLCYLDSHERLYFVTWYIAYWFTVVDMQ